MSKSADQQAINSLKEDAKIIQERINGLDKDIAHCQKERAAESKHLRSITNKIVTLEIKGAA